MRDLHTMLAFSRHDSLDVLWCCCKQVVDSAVLRFPKAVTHFSPGSHQFMPEQQTSFPNVFIAGDWVKNIDHGANGLSQVEHPCSLPM